MFRSARHWRTALILIAALATLSVVVRHAPGALASATPDQHILVPSYIVPGSGWNGIASSYPTVGIALLNINSGPGSGPETSFKNQVATEEAAGIAMYGYVSADYGNGGVSLSSAETQINDYASWYGVDDIFVDEAPTSCGVETSYFQPLYAYIHAHGGLEILNPGESTMSCYMSATDILDSFEGSYTSFASYTPASWTSGYPASRFFNEVYDTPTEGDMVTVLDRLETLNAGWVYVTNLNLPNPYNALPSYWTNEVDTVSNQETTTTGVTTSTGVTPTTQAPPPPVVAKVSKIAPKSGTATGGTEVIITGTGFRGTTKVMFGTNRHGSLPAKSFTVNSAGTTIIAYSPAERPGRVNIRVFTPAGTSAVRGADKFRFASVKAKNK